MYAISKFFGRERDEEKIPNEWRKDKLDTRCGCKCKNVKNMITNYVCDTGVDESMFTCKQQPTN